MKFVLQKYVFKTSDNMPFPEIFPLLEESRLYWLCHYTIFMGQLKILAIFVTSKYNVLLQIVIVLY